MKTKLKIGLKIYITIDMSDGTKKIKKGTSGIITHIYKTGSIRISNTISKNYSWEVFLLEKQLDGISINRRL